MLVERSERRPDGTYHQDIQDDWKTGFLDRCDMNGHYRIVYELDGQLFCEHRVSTDPRALFPVAYFCKDCGSLWAREITFVNLRWTIRDRLCEKCGDGSLLTWDFSFYYLLLNPRAVLLREIAIFDPVKFMQNKRLR